MIALLVGTWGCIMVGYQSNWKVGLGLWLISGWIILEAGPNRS